MASYVNIKRCFSIRLLTCIIFAYSFLGYLNKVPHETLIKHFKCDHHFFLNLTNIVSILFGNNPVITGVYFRCLFYNDTKYTYFLLFFTYFFFFFFFCTVIREFYLYL